MVLVLFTFFSFASKRWIDQVEAYMVSSTVWAQLTEIRVTKVESCQAQILETLAEIKAIVKNRPVCAS